MKKGLYLLLLLVTLAVGSVYQINLLMALAIGEILLWICLALVSWRCRRHLKLGFEKRVAVVLRQEKAPCTLRAENTGRTAILRFRARLRYGYPWEKKPKKLLVYGALEGREVQLSRVELPAVSCGLLHLTLDRVRVYDWLGLTSSSFSKQKAEAWLAVLPPFQEVPVDLSYRSAGDSAALLLSSLPQQNGDSEEVRQLREYREGDPTRSIHWKQSARTQTLWVKEYEQQSDRLVELHLGLNRFAFSTPSQREGFYVILSALVHGLLRALPQIPVYWTDGEGRPQGMQLSSKEGSEPLLLLLYHLEQGEGLSPEHPAPPVAPPGRILRLDFTTGLQLLEDRKLLCSFSSKQYPQQLSCFTLQL